MNLDLLFSPRTLTHTAARRPRVPNLMRHLFFPDGREHSTKYVDLKNVVHKPKVLPVVSDVASGTVLEGKTMGMKIVPTARLRPKRASSAADLLYITSENEGVELKAGVNNAAERVQEYVVDDIDFMIRSRDLTIEFMCSEVARTGKFIAPDEDGTDYSIDFKMPETHTIVLEGTDLWSDAASVPHELFQEIAKLIQDATGMRPDTVIQGTNAWNAYYKNQSVRDDLDNLRISAGTLDPNIASLYQGNMYGLGHWSYGGTFQDVHGNSRELFPPDYILMGCTNVSCSVEYGLPTDLGNTDLTKMFIKSELSFDPSELTLVGESRPAPINSEPDAFVYVKVL